MNCILCKKPIPKERLEAIPETEVCVKCSSEVPKLGLVQGSGTIGNSKGYGLVIVDGSNKLAQSYNRQRRGRSWGKGTGLQDQRSGSYWYKGKR
jgi:hypothetical protein